MTKMTIYGKNVSKFSSEPLSRVHFNLICSTDVSSTTISI